MAALDISINKSALTLVQEMVEQSQLLNIKVETLASGTTLIDTGVEAEGGFAAGKYFAEICMGGLAQVDITDFQLEGIQLPAAAVTTDHPLLSCLASQYAGWKIETNSFQGMASGPGRILARTEDIYKDIDYRDQVETAVLALETSENPKAAAARDIAEVMGIAPENLYLITAASASMVGSLQISARIVETGIHKMMELGYPLSNFKSGWGIAPIAPTAGSDLEAIGRSNDSILYGGTAVYAVTGEDSIIEEIVADIPASASPDYGKRFIELFKEYGDFYKIDPMLFSPARIIINNLNSGHVWKAGKLNSELLQQSYLELV